MPDSQGQFCWYELHTTDTEAAGAFYGSVLGWNLQDSGNPTMSYTLLKVGEHGIGGIIKLPDYHGAQPGWIAYIWVRDIDAAVEKVKAAGATVHGAIDAIPGVGRFARVSDPQGAAFILFRDFDDLQPPHVAPGTPGHTGWHELQATDTAAAFDFYAEQFGWTKGESFDMGAPVGAYQVFSTGDLPNGGMMKTMPDIPGPFWLYYFNVDDIDAAAARVVKAGGQILMGPHEVPGGAWIFQAIDLQGAIFALVQPRVSYKE